MKFFVSALCVLLFANTVYADYRGDLGINYLKGSADSGYDIPDYEPPTGTGDPEFPATETPSYSSEGDFDGWAVDGTYYLGDVDASNGPWKLAPFLSRVSSIGGGFGRIESKDADSETEFWDAFGRMIINERWVIEGGVGGTEENSIGGDSETDLYKVAVGLYFATDSQLRFAFDRADADEEDSDRWSVDVVHVRELDSGHTLHASLLFGLVAGDDDGNDIDLALSYYLNQTLGFGVDYSKQSRDEAGDTDGYKVWANYFVTEKISLELNYFELEQVSGLTIESDGVEFEAKYRF